MNQGASVIEHHGEISSEHDVTQLLALLSDKRFDVVAFRLPYNDDPVVFQTRQGTASNRSAYSGCETSDEYRAMLGVTRALLGYHQVVENSTTGKHLLCDESGNIPLRVLFLIQDNDWISWIPRVENFILGTMEQLIACIDDEQQYNLIVACSKRSVEPLIHQTVHNCWDKYDNIMSAIKSFGQNVDVACVSEDSRIASLAVLTGRDVKRFHVPNNVLEYPQSSLMSAVIGICWNIVGRNIAIPYEFCMQNTSGNRFIDDARGILTYRIINKLGESRRGDNLAARMSTMIGNSISRNTSVHENNNWLSRRTFSTIYSNDRRNGILETLDLENTIMSRSTHQNALLRELREIILYCGSIADSLRASLDELPENKNNHPFDARNQRIIFNASYAVMNYKQKSKYIDNVLSGIVGDNIFAAYSAGVPINDLCFTEQDKSLE